MARRTRRLRRPPSATVVDNPVAAGAPAEIDAATDALIEKIRVEPIGTWGIFTSHGSITVQALKPDNTYRTQPLDGTEEFTFGGLYLGKRGKLIFQFHPIDPVYKAYELDESKVFSSVKPAADAPTFEARICKALGLGDEIEWGDAGVGFAMARSQFKAKFLKALAEQEKQAEKIKLAENIERKETNPLWGMF
jgi:hypothetical protein